MGVNKDPKYSVEGSLTAIRAREKLLSYSEHDRELVGRIIDEVNSKGYYIQYLFQLQWMDKDDFEIINDIIIKYSLQFESKRAKYSLLWTLGKRGNYGATEFLLEQFRKPNDYEENMGWNFSRRGMCSSALLGIRDKSKIDDYIEIIKNENTRQDSFCFILMLGELKYDKASPLLIELLKEDNTDLQSAAIQTLAKFKNKIDLNPIMAPFLLSDNKVIRDNAKKALK